MADTTNRWYHDDPNAWWSTENPVVQDALDRVTSLAMGHGGITKVIRSNIPDGINMIRAYHNTTGEPVGHIGYKQRPGRGGRIVDVKIDPKYQKSSRYAGELLKGFVDEMGPLMDDVGVAGTITNSPSFWKSLARRFKDHPKVGIIDELLGQGGFD
jgi:hypothetical protein